MACITKSHCWMALAADIKVMKSRLLVYEDHKKVILNTRPTVQFKIGAGMSLGAMQCQAYRKQFLR